MCPPALLSGALPVLQQHKWGILYIYIFVLTCVPVG